ncbi:MAG: glycosyltransferase [Bacteroidetes bacterium]|nr:glycosyltransferase [Bacteroidota bacterium]
MKVSVIIVNFNVQYFLEVCLHSVMRALAGIEFEVFVVDNLSKDGSLEMVRKKFPQVRLIANQENVGFGRANNQAYSLCTGEYVLFLNPDTVLPEDFFTKCLAYLDKHPSVGGIGPRLIDGKGQFAPDAKKSFPSLSVALFKGTGINRLFPKSPLFNRYYAVHIGEHQTAEVDALSGCCMMMRQSAIKQAGGAFDEDFFMYFEDGDLCYRIRKAGLTNIYYPDVTVVHYKGESTRKSTLSYVRVFNEAFAIFAKKHYSRQYARLFLLFINLGVALRAVLGAFKTLLKVVRMPLLDVLVLFALLWIIKDYWTQDVKDIKPIPLLSVYATFPVYLLLWLIMLYLNGAYDKPYRAVRVVRGMVVGTVLCLAYLGLLPSSLRYSRAIIVLTGISGIILLPLMYEVLYRVGILKLVHFDALPKKAVIAGTHEQFDQTVSILRKIHYAPDIYGRVAISEEQGNDCVASLDTMKSFLQTAAINEVIFCADKIPYSTILEQMEVCGRKYDYKIHLTNSLSFVGSNSSDTSGDLYIADRRFNIARFSEQRNKRVMDVILSLCLLVFSPVLIWRIERPGQYLRNCFRVLFGQRSWVGYSLLSAELPDLKLSILPPYNILTNYTPSDVAKSLIDEAYATHYHVSHDLSIVWGNRRFLGRKS